MNVIVIRGAGGNFCAGGDFAEVERLDPRAPTRCGRCSPHFGGPATPSRRRGPGGRRGRGCRDGGRFRADAGRRHRAVSATTRKIADNHINFGMIPGGGSTQRLPRLVGRQLALGLLLSGDRLTGPDAMRLGLAYRSFAPDEFDDGVRHFVDDAGRPRPRVAVTTIKRLVYAGQRASLAATGSTTRSRRSSRTSPGAESTSSARQVASFGTTVDDGTRDAGRRCPTASAGCG